MHFALEELGNEYLDLGSRLLPPGTPFDKLKREDRILLHLNPKCAWSCLQLFGAVEVRCQKTFSFRLTEMIRRPGAFS